MRVLSLFAGIGGFDLGLERAGMKVVGQCEIDPYCRRVLRKHWPDVWLHDDVRTLTGDIVREQCGQIDVICGGYPCQPFSVAGKREGENDKRHLWPEFARLIREVGPRFVLLENVPGHLSLGFGQVLGDLAQSGYDAEWACVPASAFGALHRRNRMWVVAHTSGKRHRKSEERVRPGGHTAESGCEDLADPHGERELQPQGGVGKERGRAGDSGAQAAPHSDGTRRQGQREPSGPEAQVPWLGSLGPGIGAGRDWAVEPDVGRVADGVPNRVDRLRALGNAIVPQCAEWIGRCVMAAAK